MKNNLRMFWGEVTRLLCSLAIIFIAFAHTASISNAGSHDPSGYTLPDGSVPSICLNSGVDYDGGSVSTECEFCRISGAVLPVNAIGFSQHVIFEVVEITSSGGQVIKSGSLQQSVCSLRGPPIV